ncbi:MAG TPA: nuclear transport factor 2 family protein [Rhodanobacter sp.]|nr:nuclear transport factor 2 family protein [Rhodanobacter sp.]
MDPLDRRGFLQRLGASVALMPFAGVAMAYRGPSTVSPVPGRQGPVSAESDTPAVAVARAHIKAWSNHDFAAARKSLAADIHFTAMSTQPAIAPTNLVGVDDYMEGLVRFARAIVPASVRVIASVGDERNALIMLTVKAVLGLGAPKTLPAARLYRLDGQGKIEGEQVIFYVDRS